MAELHGEGSTRKRHTLYVHTKKERGEEGGGGGGGSYLGLISRELHIWYAWVFGNRKLLP